MFDSSSVSNEWFKVRTFALVIDVTEKLTLDALSIEY